MGEAEAEAEAAAVETLTEDGSEAGKGGGAGGGSLPPRKRLLNSLKAGSGGNGNGSSGGNDKSMGEGAGVEGAAAVKQEDCVRCGSKENSAWRRVKKSGVYQRLCNSCTLHYSLNMFCPYCLVVYQDAGTLGDPAIWLNCCNCRRSVHIVCEVNSSSGGTPDPNAYVCPECRKSKELPNGAVAKGKNKAAAGDSTSPASPTHKKPRTGRESRPNDGSEVQVEKVEGGLPAAGAKPSSSGPQEALTAAKNAAQLAQKAAAAAKATAAAKAQAAAKAAIAARAALEAAAQAARAEVHARAELRRNGVRMEPRLGFNMITPKLDPLDKGKEESPAEADDEELARQLHRAMNSPRVPRTPRRKPEGVSPGASPSSIEPKDEPGLHDFALQKQQQVMSRPAILRPDSAVKQEEHNNEGLFEHPGMTEAVSSAVDTHGFPSTYLLNPESSDANNAFPFGDILAGFPSHEMQAEEHGVTSMDVDGSAGADEEGTSMEVDNSGLEDQGTAGPQLGVSISEGHVVLQGMPAAAGMLPESIVTEQQVVAEGAQAEDIATEEMEELENKNESVMLEPNPEGAALTTADVIIEGGSAAGENEIPAPLIAEAEIAGDTGAEQQAALDHKHVVAEETVVEIAQETAVEIAEKTAVEIAEKTAVELAAETAVEIAEETAVAKAEDAAATLKEGDLPLANETDNTDTPFLEEEGGKTPDGLIETSGKWNEDFGAKISEEVKGDIVSGQVGGELKDEKHQTETGHQAAQVIAGKEENDGDTRPATEDVQMPAASVDKGTKVEGSVGVVDSEKEAINGSDGKTGDTVEVTGVPGQVDTMTNGAHPDNPAPDFEVAKVSDMDEDAMKIMGTLVSGKQQQKDSLGDVKETQDMKLTDTGKSLFSDDSQQAVDASGDQAVLKDRE